MFDHSAAIGPTPRDRMRSIVAQIASEHGITPAELMGRCRRDKFVEARRDAICTIIRLYPEMSYPQVGRFFGLDHTTCLHHVREAGEYIPRIATNQARQIIDWRRTQPGPDMQAAE
jgi:chromosomal replication initiation ATPase DnaA